MRNLFEHPWTETNKCCCAFLAYFIRQSQSFSWVASYKTVRTLEHSLPDTDRYLHFSGIFGSGWIRRNKWYSADTLNLYVTCPLRSPWFFLIETLMSRRCDSAALQQPRGAYLQLYTPQKSRRQRQNVLTHNEIVLFHRSLEPCIRFASLSDGSTFHATDIYLPGVRKFVKCDVSRAEH